MFIENLKFSDDVLWKQKILYINDDPGTDFLIMHQKSNQTNIYLVVTRSKTPSGQHQAINTTLINLNRDQNELRVKSTNYGMLQVPILNFNLTNCFVYSLSFFISSKIKFDEKYVEHCYNETSENSVYLLHIMSI